ncbi:MAG TPA: AMP-binding protein [Rhizomicrobium sp.]|nr:AMP-binding protein [Rhizomicrobium sp.]
MGGLRRYSVNHSAFYREFHDGYAGAPLEELPILTKDRLIASFDKVVTDTRVTAQRVQAFAENMTDRDLLDGRYHVVATSGTTGNRGFFLFTKQEWRVLAMASVARGMRWSNSAAGPAKRGVVMASTIPWHMTARAAAELRRLGLSGGRLGIDAGAPIAAIVASLNEYQPKVMMVYPSVMQILAEEQLAGRLRISPAHIQCTSEVLTEDARHAIEHAFRVSPANLYAASECGCIAASCEANEGLHFNEDLLIVESVDHRGRPVPDGEVGERTLITVLANRTLPLIRYELSDRIALTRTPCGCGKPYLRITEVVGRQGDVLRLPARNAGQVDVAPAQITACLRGTGVRQWQISIGPQRIELRCLCPEEEFRPADIVGRLSALLEERGVAPIAISAKRVDALERGLTGKSRQITTITR